MSLVERSLRRTGNLLCCLLILLLMPTSGLHAQGGSDDTEKAEALNRLESVRGEIRRITTEQRALKSQQTDAAKALREADQAVSEAVATRRSTDMALSEQREKLEQLQVQRDELGRRLGKQRESLAALVRMAYALGRDQRLKLLLAQDRLDEAARALAYQRYFQRDQIERIRNLLGDLQELRALGDAVASQTTKLDRALVEQQRAVDQLSAQRQAQQAVVDTLSAQVKDRGTQLAELQRDERNLVELVERLRDVFADIPQQGQDVLPFAKQQGKLQWPLTAPIRVGYGGTLPDGRTSRGWLLAAKAGTQVSAIAGGRIAFSDWLRGYGLIVIVDHQDGYMSLYAQNEALLKSVGDWVSAGETVSTVGRSGGQGQPALYFELRRNGKPVDPKLWLSRR